MQYQEVKYREYSKDRGYSVKEMELNIRYAPDVKAKALVLLLAS